MSQLINLGCSVADVHRRYDETHKALFGASSFRLVIDAVRGRQRDRYKEFSHTLTGLRDELDGLEKLIADAAQEAPVVGADRELHRVLLEYTQALSKAMTGLGNIYRHLAQDETAYRDSGADGRSSFTRDKVQYDGVLSDLERLGTRLNRLFANY